MPRRRFVLLEHGLGIDPKVQGWRQRLNPIQRFVGNGCRLDLDVPVIVGSQPFSEIRIDRFELERVPRMHGTIYRGVAVK